MKQKVRFQNLADGQKDFILSAKEFSNYLSELLHEIENPNDHSTREMLADFREQLLENYYTYKFLCREFGWLPSADIKQLEPYILLQEQRKGLNLQLRVKDRDEWLENDMQLGKTTTQHQPTPTDDIFAAFGEMFSQADNNKKLKLS